MNLQPRMLQSKEGGKIATESTKILAKKYFDGKVEEEDDLSSDVEEVKKPVVSLNELFPEIKSEAEAPFKATPKKLGFEEDKIC